jgi:hypothetical protein
MSREKRTAPATVYMPPLLAKAVQHVAANDRRSISTFFCRLAEEHPTVKVVLQQIASVPRGQ